MNKIFQISLVLLLTFCSSRAFAGFIFNIESYTESSITFTIDGDMLGYSNGPEQNIFGLVYYGDIWANNPNYAANVFSDSVFDNVSVFGGNTGTFSGSRAYTWTSGAINLAVASMNTTTISWDKALLNVNASNWSVDLVQGNGYSGNPIEVLASVNRTAQVSVPEPSTLAIFALGIIGLASRRYNIRSKK